MFTLKICVRVFWGSIGARLLELTLHMDDEIWDGVTGNLAHFSYSSLYLSIFSLSVQDKFMSHFSQELLKINTSYLVYR